jgi:hypothetical protein
MKIVMGDGTITDQTDPVVIAGMLYQGGSVIRPDGSLAIVQERSGTGPSDPTGWTIDGVPLAQAIVAPAPGLPAPPVTLAMDATSSLLPIAAGLLILYFLFK